MDLGSWAAACSSGPPALSAILSEFACEVVGFPLWKFWELGSSVHAVHSPSFRWVVRERRVRLQYFLGTPSMKGGVGKGLLLGYLTQKPGNVIGTGRGERGQQEWFFLGFGFWVLGRGQHGEKPSWSARFQDVRAGNRGLAGMALE